MGRVEEGIPVGVLQRFERRLEGLVEGAFARVFKGVVEPVEVASALQREAADHKAILGQGRVLVPNRYVVELSPTDYQRLTPYARPLAEELATMLREHLEEQHWTTFGRITVVLDKVDGLDTGVFRVRSSVDADAPPERRASTTTTAPAASGNATARLVAASGGTSYPLRPGAIVIGRAEDVQVRLPDVGISRRHAQLRFDGTRAVVTDLGSTNGTLVNGQRVAEQELQNGDRLQLGSTVLVFRMDG